MYFVTSTTRVKTLNMSLKTNSSTTSRANPNSKKRPRSSIRTEPLVRARKSIFPMTSSVNNETVSENVTDAKERNC